MPTQFTSGIPGDVIHAFIASLGAMRYLWPLWLVIGVLWLLTRMMRAVGRFFGFSQAPAKSTKPMVRPRR